MEKRKDPTMEFVLFTHAPLFFQFVVIFVIFPRNRLFLSHPWTVGGNMIDNGGTRRGVGLHRKKTRNRKNWEEEVVDTRSLISVGNTEVEERMLTDREKNRVARI